MVELGVQNSRMKDFYDVFVLSRMFEFSGASLSAALKATFARRGTPLPSMVPLALTDGFAKDPMKQQQWSAFLRKSQFVEMAFDLATVTGAIREFLSPVVDGARAPDGFVRLWLPGGFWR